MFRGMARTPQWIVKAAFFESDDGRFIKGTELLCLGLALA